MRALRWSVVVDDPDRWTPERRLAADIWTEHDGGWYGAGYDDWVVAGLADAMRKAGEAFIAANPDLFRGGLT